MLTKGIILSVDLQENTCLVRIPIFETAGNIYKNEATAIICIPPGIYNGLKADDVVIIGFEDNNSGKPIILGKLYLGVTSEVNSSNGSGVFSTLKISDTLEIPVNTKINYSKNEAKIYNEDSVLNNINSLNDIINAINSLDRKIKNININNNDYSTVEQQVGTLYNKDLYRKSYYIDFRNLDIGQIKNSEWVYNLDIDSDIDFVKFLTNYSYINSTTEIIKFSNNSNTNYEVKDNVLEITTVENQDAKYKIENNNIIISGKTRDFTLLSGYITIEYIKA
jgi:hypothetical protein